MSVQNTQKNEEKKHKTNMEHTPIKARHPLESRKRFTMFD